MSPLLALPVLQAGAGGSQRLLYLGSGELGVKKSVFFSVLKELL